MRFVSLHKPIQFFFPSPDKGGLTLRIRRPGSFTSQAIYFDTLYQCYLAEVTFSESGNYLLSVELSPNHTISTQVIAGDGDGTYYFHTPESLTGETVEWYLYDLGTRSQIAQGIFQELGEGFYWMQLPRTLREGNYLVKFYYPRSPGYSQMWPLSFGREVLSFATMYVNDISLANNSLSSGSSSNSSFCTQALNTILRL